MLLTCEHGSSVLAAIPGPGNRDRMGSARRAAPTSPAPESLYDMVCDVTRMGEWSPVCLACWWDDGQGAIKKTAESEA
jgi:hypothetical protein